MHTFHLGRIIPVLVLFPLALTAQVLRDVVPLKNWPAPLYWQPSQAQSEAARVKGAATIRTSFPDSTSAGFLVFVAMTPCRVVDTRASQGFPYPFGQPSLTPGPARTFPIQSSTLCSIPLVAQAYSFNVTVVPPGPLGYLIVWPEGQPQPVAVTLDDLEGQIVNNGAIVPAGTPNGSISAVVNDTTDLVIDINGYYMDPTDLANNTSLGEGAAASITTGTNNTAIGIDALSSDNSGCCNTASGASALLKNTTGSNNTASGADALQDNNTGGSNTASGALALRSNTTGSNNTASGLNALNNNTTGSNNTALGNQAGFNITGSNNIDIGSQGTSGDGATMNSGVIRVGDNSYQTSFFAAGIFNVPTLLPNALPVLIDGNGQLGTSISSRRFKEDIQDMGEASSDLLRLRPVTYRYKKPYADGSKPIDYGLIAEEVAEVYPDLVVKGADGQVETVQYHKLVPMLLNELQKEHETTQALLDKVELLQVQVSELQKAQEIPASK
jgi:endosialidase-like protein